MKAVTEERLSEIQVEFSDACDCCVIMASKGYPASYEKGFEITIPKSVSDSVFVAGATLSDGKLLTNGGRVLGATAVAESLEEAIDSAYQMVNKIHFDNAYFRRDIGKKALELRGK